MQQPSSAATGPKVFGAVSITDSHLLTGWGMFPLTNVSSAMAADVKYATMGVGVFLVVVGVVVALAGLGTVVNPRDDGRAVGVVMLMLGVGSLAWGIHVFLSKGKPVVLVTMAGGEQTTIRFREPSVRAAFLSALMEAVASRQQPSVHQDNRQVHVHPAPQLDR